MEKRENILVSIIVVAYQSEAFILEVLESIRLQIWENIELIITDDGSTDNTVQICRNWLEKNKSRFSNTTLLTSNVNTGIPANCNRGVSKAQGEWVKLIGADDILMENCISENMKVIIQNPDITFVISELIEISEDGTVLNEYPTNDGLRYFIKNQGSKKNQLKAYARWPAFLNTPTFFLKRELIEDIFVPNTKIKIYEDTFAVFNILNKGAKIFFLAKPTIKYRIHDNAISRNKKINDKREKEAYKIYKKYRREYLSAFNLLDLSVFYENWLRFKFKGIKGHKGISVLRKFSLFYWHLKIKGFDNI